MKTDLNKYMLTEFLIGFLSMAYLIMFGLFIFTQNILFMVVGVVLIFVLPVFYIIKWYYAGLLAFGKPASIKKTIIIEKKK